jgi:hypothetical protein
MANVYFGWSAKIALHIAMKKRSPNKYPVTTFCILRVFKEGLLRTIFQIQSFNIVLFV